MIMKRNLFNAKVMWGLVGLIIVIWAAGGFLLSTSASEKKPDFPLTDVNAVVSGNNEFAIELYKKIANDPNKIENLFFSPYSISTAIAMTYASARGNTEKQMAEVLHFNLPQEQLHPVFSSLEKVLNEQGKKGAFELTVANALWGQKGYKFLDSFTDLVNKNYSTGLNKVDFAKDSEGARQTINKWVEEKTKNKIKELIKPDILTGLTRLVLTNTIYFKGKWQYEFDKKDTKEALFHITAQNSVTVPMMYIKKEFKYGGDESGQILEIGYKGEDLSMIVLLPKEIEGISKIEKSLTAENLDKWLGKLRKQEVRVYFPRFKMTSEFDLLKVLSKMGMPDAFNDLKADFSGMNGGKDLYISNVLHKAFVEVNEEGTEAAASTAVVMALKGVAKPTIFRADHPFIYIIRDNITGSILFMGKVCDPREK
jgi:serpin B